MTNISNESLQSMQSASDAQSLTLSTTDIQKFRDYFLAHLSHQKNPQSKSNTVPPQKKPSKETYQSPPKPPLIHPTSENTTPIDDDCLARIASATLISIVQHVESASLKPNIQHMVQLNVSLFPTESMIITVHQKQSSAKPNVQIHVSNELMALIGPMLPQLKQRLKEKNIAVDAIILSSIDEPPKNFPLNKS